MIDYTTNANQNSGIQWTAQDPLTGNLFNPNACAAAGGCSGQITISAESIQPVEQQIPISWYVRMSNLWLEAKDENTQLKQRIAELEARLAEA